MPGDVPTFTLVPELIDLNRLGRAHPAPVGGGAVPDRCADRWALLEARLQVAQVDALLHRAAGLLATVETTALPRAVASAVRETADLLSGTVRPLAEARRGLIDDP